MAKPKKTKSPSVVTQEMKENRQKTYTILRALWKKHRNDEFREEIFEYEGKEVRRKKKKVDIYDFMGIPANRYAKIINGEYDMPLLKESEVLEEKTGIERGIFTGVI